MWISVGAGDHIGEIGAGQRVHLGERLAKHLRGCGLVDGGQTEQGRHEVDM